MNDELALLPDDERLEMEAYIAKFKDQKHVKFEKGQIVGDSNLEKLRAYKRIQEATKTSSPDNALSIIHSAAACHGTKDERFIRAVNMIEELAPQTPLEAMLVAQMLAVNGAVKRLMANAFLPNQTFEGKQLNLNQATKMQRTYLQQVEALQKLRGLTGQQTVRVEHVTVEAGGQAIVGNVDRGGGG